MSFPSGHALLIGTGTYQHEPQANVPIAVRDAAAVRAALIDPHYCGYTPERMTFLHDETATRAGVLAALEMLAQQTNADSTVFIFYTGHGADGTNGHYYLTTHDTRVEGGRVQAGTGVSAVELMARLREIKAKRVLVIINACHSGELSPNLDVNGPSAFSSTPPSPSTIDALLSTGEGRIFIVACRPEQKSWFASHSAPLSYFGQAVVAALRGEGLFSNNGYVSAFGLYEQVYEVTKAAAAQAGQPQEPELTVLRGVGPFPVALYRGATSLGEFVQEPLPPETAAREVDPKKSQRLLDKAIQQISVTVGDGNITAQGNNNTIIGAGAVQASGPVGGDIVTGSKTTYGAQTNIGGQVQGPVLSGQFGGPVTVGNITTGDISGSDVRVGHGTPTPPTEQKPL